MSPVYGIFISDFLHFGIELVFVSILQGKFEAYIAGQGILDM